MTEFQRRVLSIIENYKTYKKYTSDKYKELVEKYNKDAGNQSILTRAINYITDDQTESRIGILTTLEKKIKDDKDKNDECDSALFELYYECYSSITYGAFLTSTLQMKMEPILTDFRNGNLKFKTPITHFTVFSLALKQKLSEEYNKAYARASTGSYFFTTGQNALKALAGYLVSKIFPSVTVFSTTALQELFSTDPRTKILKSATNYCELIQSLNEQILDVIIDDRKKFINELAELNSIFSIAHGAADKIIEMYARDEYINNLYPKARMKQILTEAFDEEKIKLEKLNPKKRGRDETVSDEETEQRVLKKIKTETSTNNPSSFTANIGSFTSNNTNNTNANSSSTTSVDSSRADDTALKNR